MDTAALAGVCAVVVLGAGLQRVAGMGLGMVAAPVLTLVLGPAPGVFVSNAGAAVTALLVLGALRRHVDWPRFWRMMPLLAVGSVLGALAVRGFPTAWLDILVGGSVLLALAVTLMLRRPVPAGGVPTGGTPAAVGTGLAAGFMNTAAGVAAPALTAYALATRWEHRSFAATLQPVLLVANVTSLVTKSLLGAVTARADLPWWTWPVVVGGVCVGVGLGSLLSRRVPVHVARRLAVAVSVAGATTALARGVLAV